MGIGPSSAVGSRCILPISSCVYELRRIFKYMGKAPCSSCSAPAACSLCAAPVGSRCHVTKRGGDEIMEIDLGQLLRRLAHRTDSSHITMHTEFRAFIFMGEVGGTV